MDSIPLTQGEYAIVDDCDYDRLNRYKWHLSKTRNSKYAKRSQYIAGKGVSIFMHRIISICLPPDLKTDHANGDGLDNRRANLRFCTVAENAWNQGPYSDTSSKYKGVYWHKDIEKWAATIQVNGKQLSLGYFEYEEDAATAYDIAALRYHGEYARTNDIATQALEELTNETSRSTKKSGHKSIHQKC